MKNNIKKILSNRNVWKKIERFAMASIDTVSDHR
jgi:hypothetical protein